MSDLQLNPEFENPACGSAPRGAVPADATATPADSALAPACSARRRAGARRLRLPSDDGFHLFRVY